MTLLAAVAVIANNLNNEVALRLPDAGAGALSIDIQPQQQEPLRDGAGGGAG